jgi:hypothetical protein
MKSSLLRTFFEWALITSVLMSVGFLTWYCFKSRAARAENSRLASAQIDLQNNRAVIGMLLSECQAYGRTNADMARLLATGGPAAPAPTATTKPGAK